MRKLIKLNKMAITNFEKQNSEKLSFSKFATVVFYLYKLSLAHRHSTTVSLETNNFVEL